MLVSELLVAVSSELLIDGFPRLAFLMMRYASIYFATFILLYCVLVSAKRGYSDIS